MTPYRGTKSMKVSIVNASNLKKVGWAVTKFEIRGLFCVTSPAL